MSASSRACLMAPTTSLRDLRSPSGEERFPASWRPVDWIVIRELPLMMRSATIYGLKLEIDYGNSEHKAR